jgi:hypothetical protein
LQGAKSSSSGAKKSGGGFFGVGKNKDKNKNKAGFGQASAYDEPVDDKPALIEGWVEKKGGGKVKLGSEWQKRYVFSVFLVYVQRVKIVILCIIYISI